MKAIVGSAADKRTLISQPARFLHCHFGKPWQPNLFSIEKFYLYAL